jgi:ubiquinone/menaquinone biosynthesis C-methylase UbiE
MSRASELFGAVASSYALHRLTYPEAFFDAFVQRLPQAGSSTVWDCGCGNGQASIALAERVRSVIATDASAEQLAAAFPHPRVRYRHAAATRSGLADDSVNGVLVAAAIHWFAGEAFNREVRRVCRPGAVMAWIGYLPPLLNDAGVQGHLDRFYHHTLSPWWPAERHWVESSYAGLPFPGREWPFPQGLWIERQWCLAELIGHVGTWSAVQRAREAGETLLPFLETQLRAAWPADGELPLRVRWPFMGRWGEVD